MFRPFLQAIITQYITLKHKYVYREILFARSQRNILPEDGL
jgi:hypothetical protein